MMTKWDTVYIFSPHDNKMNMYQFSVFVKLINKIQFTKWTQE